jgi:hypothetical protein
MIFPELCDLFSRPMTATYREIGRRIVGERQGKQRADYREQLIESLSLDLRPRFGRGFGKSTCLKCGSLILSGHQASILQTVLHAPDTPVRTKVDCV